MAAITLNGKDTEVAVIVYLEIPNGNMLGWVTRQKGEEWAAGYRFRYFRDDEVSFKSKDDKAFYNLRGPRVWEGTQDELKTMLRQAITDVFTFSAAKFGLSIPDFFAVDMNGSDASDELMTKPWANMQNAPGGTA